MVAPSAKLPRITNADKAAIVKDPGTLVFNDSSGFPEYVNSLGSFIELSPGGVVANVIQQQLWVNFADGLDTNDGGLYTPFKTYAAAAAHAALSASPTNRFLLNIIGDQASTSPVIYPYVDICWYAGTWTVSGGLGLDASWDTVVNNEILTIQGMKLNGFWVWSWHGNTGNVIKFVNCDHSLTQTGNCLSNPGSANAFMILNDIGSGNTSYSSGMFVINSASYLRGAKVAGAINYNLVSDGYTLNHYLYDSDIPFGIVVKKDIPNTSTQNIYVKNTPMPVNSPVLEDVDSNVIIDTDSYQNDPTFFGTGTYANMITKGVNGVRQVLYINAAVGNDLNNGSPNAPMATYDAARLLAISKGASLTNQFTIFAVGNFSITGNFTISPFVNLTGTGMFSTNFTISGNIVNDTSFNTTANPLCTIQNINFTAAAGVINYSSYQNNSAIIFNMCSVAGVPTFSMTGSGVPTGEVEQVYFLNCMYGLFVSFGATVFTSHNIGAIFINSDVSGGITSSSDSADFGSYTAIITDNNNIGNCSFSCSSAGGLLAILSASANGANVTLDGTNVQLEADAFKYNLILTGGATLAQVSLFSFSDGIEANTNFTPSNYTPTAGAKYKSNSVTGNLAGIDSALAGKAGAIPYVEVTTLTQVMSSNVEYTANNSSQVALTLPTNSAVGDIIRVNGKGSGGWRIAQQNAGHIIHVGASNTTMGGTGSVSSATQYASLTLKCITANNVWVGIATSGATTAYSFA